MPLIKFRGHLCAPWNSHHLMSKILFVVNKIQQSAKSQLQLTTDNDSFESVCQNENGKTECVKMVRQNNSKNCIAASSSEMNSLVFFRNIQFSNHFTHFSAKHTIFTLSLVKF